METTNVKEMTNHQLVRLTIMALNCGEYDAMMDADAARKEAYRRGDKDTIDMIEYYWDVI